MTMLMIMLAVLVQQSADQNGSVVINERIEHFDVPGRNYQRFYDQVEDYGPLGRFSAVRYTFNASWRYQQYQSKCSVDQAQLVFDIVYHLPQWERFETANERERAAFAEMYNAELEFLYGYKAVLSDHGERLVASLVETQPMACSALQAHLDLELQQGSQVFSEAVDAYESTAHEVERRDTSCHRRGSRIRRC